MACDPWIIIKILLFILSIVCLILKRVTDYDASRLFFYLEKLSYEWPLLTNITWDEHGAAFVDVTYGGFILITAGLLVAAASGELRRKNNMETFFLVLGGLMFGAAGALILAALDQVPPKLVDNAAALGVISLITALLFFTDIAVASKRRKRYKPPPSPAPIKRTTVATQTLDGKSFIGPLYVTQSETPIHRFHHTNQTIPKWIAEPGETGYPPAQQQQQQGGENMSPPPAGFVHDAPSRGFVMKTVQNWPKSQGLARAAPAKVTRTASNDSRISQETLDVEDVNHYQPHSVEITTETPRTVINTKVLHRWLNQKRDSNGTNLI